jgi:pyrimidine operon attenuation protein/uracil phosphoribosyltransferase
LDPYLVSGEFDKPNKVQEIALLLSKGQRMFPIWLDYIKVVKRS